MRIAFGSGFDGGRGLAELIAVQEAYDACSLHFWCSGSRSALEVITWVHSVAALSWLRCTRRHEPACTAPLDKVLKGSSNSNDRGRT